MRSLLTPVLIVILLSSQSAYAQCDRQEEISVRISADEFEIPDMMLKEVLAIRPPKALKTHPRHPNGILLQFDQQDIHFKVAPSVLGLVLTGIKRLDLSSQAIQPHTLSRPGLHRLVAHSL